MVFIFSRYWLESTIRFLFFVNRYICVGDDTIICQCKLNGLPTCGCGNLGTELAIRYAGDAYLFYTTKYGVRVTICS